MNTTTKVAVIGLGNIGTAVASNLVKGNRAVIVADRTITKANALAQELGSLAQPLSIAEAIKEADIVVLAIWFNATKEVLQQYATELEGKIIVDPSNPIAPDEKGGFKKIIAENESAGEIIASLLPKNAKLVKALGTLGVASLTNAAFQQPANVLFYATDDTSINEEVEQLIHDNGFEPVRVGGTDQSIRIEVFGDLHEFGALGKAVTISEAKEKI
ncbi:MAG: NAD(P)-binding domain-containing protein [Lacibacter sp.]|nr:NAD(P)-binding domain-containing protein [Lacibacter sp.]